MEKRWALVGVVACAGLFLYFTDDRGTLATPPLEDVAAQPAPAGSSRDPAVADVLTSRSLVEARESPTDPPPPPTKPGRAKGREHDFDWVTCPEGMTSLLARVRPYLREQSYDIDPETVLPVSVWRGIHEFLTRFMSDMKRVESERARLFTSVALRQLQAGGGLLVPSQRSEPDPVIREAARAAATEALARRSANEDPTWMSSLDGRGMRLVLVRRDETPEIQALYRRIRESTQRLVQDLHAAVSPFLPLGSGTGFMQGGAR